jgi:hypothetical protein
MHNKIWVEIAIWVGYQLEVVCDQALCLNYIEHAEEALEHLHNVASLLIGETFLAVPPVIVMTVLVA